MQAVAGAVLVSAAAAAGVAASVFLFGKDAKSNQKKLRGWAIKAKGEVVDEMERMAHISHDHYNDLVDGVSKKYAALNHVNKKELTGLTRELKSHWAHISNEVMRGSKSKR